MSTIEKIKINGTEYDLAGGSGTGGVPKVSTPNRIYGTSLSGAQTTYAVTTDTTANAIPKRDLVGNLTTNTPVKGGDCINLDHHNAALAGKVDKITSEWRVYGTKAEGEQTSYRLGSNATADTVAQRTSTGTLRTATPVNDDDAVNLGYLNNRLEEIGGGSSGGSTGGWNEYRVYLSDLDENRTITIPASKNTILCFVKIAIDNGYCASTDPFVCAMFDDNSLRSIPLYTAQGSNDGFGGKFIVAHLSCWDDDGGVNQVFEITLPDKYLDCDEVCNDAGFTVTIYYQTF